MRRSIMKKRKMLAILMAAIITIASIPGITVQADSISKEAQACKELGILLGDGNNGVTAQYLAQNPTRLQAYLFALRLKGLYEEVGKYTSSNNFSDVSKAAWAKNYLAYAKNTPELGWGGYSDGRFGVDDKMNAQAFYKVLLETLGYKQNVDFTYAQTFEFADKIGLVEDAGEIREIKSFTINDIAKGIYGALSTNIAGADKKLVDVLVDKGIFKPEIVEKTGLNSRIRITAMVDDKNGIAWVPVEDTYKKMGCYIGKDAKGTMYYEIRKGTASLKMTEGVASALVNDTKTAFEKPVMKGERGIYYVPVSFVLASAREFGYDAEYLKAGKILELHQLARIKATQGEIVIAKGDKKSINVQKKYSEIQVGNITSQCTFAAAVNNGIVQVGGTTGEVTGKSIGSAEIVISYEGKEVDRVTVYVVDVVPKYYPVSYYEQVFDTTFRLDKPNYTDSFGAVWNKMTGVMLKNTEDDSMDTGSSLNLLNYSGNGTGITADLSKLLENRAIKGKTSTLKISAKAVGDSAKLYVKVSSKSKYGIVSKENTVVLGSKWNNIELLKIDIPEDAYELTLSIGVGKNEEVRLDAFTMTSN
jgi:hypothetical protein